MVMLIVTKLIVHIEDCVEICIYIPDIAGLDLSSKTIVWLSIWHLTG